MTNVLIYKDCLSSISWIGKYVKGKTCSTMLYLLCVSVTQCCFLSQQTLCIRYYNTFCQTHRDIYISTPGINHLL